MADRKASSVDPVEPESESPAPSEGGGFKRRAARLYNVEPEASEVPDEPTPRSRRRVRGKSATKAKAESSQRGRSKVASKPKKSPPRKPKGRQGKTAEAKVGQPQEIQKKRALPKSSAVENRGVESSARDLVRRYALGAAGVGIIPVPIVDLVAMPVLLVKMLREMARLYGIEYSEQRTKIYVTALLGFVAPASALTTLGQVFRFSPGAGFILGPAAAWTATWAVGEVFLRHFELGGTLLDFDVEAMRGEVEKKVAASREKPSS